MPSRITVLRAATLETSPSKSPPRPRRGTFRSLPSLLSVARARTAPTALQPAHRVRPEQTRGPLGTPALLVRQVPLARTALPVPTVSPLVRTVEMDNLAATVIPARQAVPAQLAEWAMPVEPAVRAVTAEPAARAEKAVR